MSRVHDTTLFNVKNQILDRRHRREHHDRPIVQASPLIRLPAELLFHIVSFVPISSILSLAVTCRRFYPLLKSTNLENLDALPEGIRAFLGLMDIQYSYQACSRFWNKFRIGKRRPDESKTGLQVSQDSTNRKLRLYISSYFTSTRILNVGAFHPTDHHDGTADLLDMLPAGYSETTRYRMKYGSLFASTQINLTHFYRSFVICPHLECYSKWRYDAVLLVISAVRSRTELWSRFVNFKSVSSRKALLSSDLSSGLHRCQDCATEWKADIKFGLRMKCGIRDDFFSTLTIWKDLGQEGKWSYCSRLSFWPGHSWYVNTSADSYTEFQKAGPIRAVFEEK